MKDHVHATETNADCYVMGAMKHAFLPQPTSQIRGSATVLAFSSEMSLLWVLERKGRKGQR